MTQKLTLLRLRLSEEDVTAALLLLQQEEAQDLLSKDDNEEVDKMKLGNAEYDGVKLAIKQVGKLKEAVAKP